MKYYCKKKIFRDEKVKGKKRYDAAEKKSTLNMKN